MAEDGGRGAAIGSTWVEQALRAHEDRSLARVTVVRSAMFAAIWLWLAFNYGAVVARENAGIILLIIGFGLAAYALCHGRSDRQWARYLFVVADAALLAFTLFAPGRTYPDAWPWPMVLRESLFLFFLTFPVLAALSFRPFLVLWAGLVSAGTLVGVTVLIGLTPGATVGMGPPPDGDPTGAAAARYLAPTFVEPDDAVVRAFVVLLLSAVLAYAAWRARQLVFDQAEAGRQRANLARYVAPSMVERLARSDNPLAPVRRQEVAVLFCDVRGFTALAETLSPDATMAFLREFHARMAQCVFDHGGTLDKFIGDGIMATFGTPETAPDDAARALACCRAMQAALASWNALRAGTGDAVVAAGIGLHFGPVIMGDIGGAQRFEFAVIGDTVNVAERLQELCRPLGVDLVTSDWALRRAGIVAPAAAGFVAVGEHRLRGRAAPLTLWGWRAPPWGREQARALA